MDFTFTAPAKTETCLVDDIGSWAVAWRGLNQVQLLSTASWVSQPSFVATYRDLACSHLLPGSRRRLEGGWYMDWGCDQPIENVIGMDDGMKLAWTHPPLCIVVAAFAWCSCQHHQVVNRQIWCVPTSTRTRRPCLAWYLFKHEK